MTEKGDCPGESQGPRGNKKKTKQKEKNGGHY